MAFYWHISINSCSAHECYLETKWDCHDFGLHFNHTEKKSVMTIITICFFQRLSLFIIWCKDYFSNTRECPHWKT